MTVLKQRIDKHARVYVTESILEVPGSSMTLCNPRKMRDERAVRIRRGRN